MSSEINKLGASGIGAHVVQKPQHAEQHSEPAPQVIFKKSNVEMPKASTPSVDLVASRQNVKEAVVLLNNQLASNKRGIGFTVNSESNTPIVTVRNTNTGEVVRQIPNEVVIKVAQSIDGFKGLMLNKKA